MSQTTARDFSEATVKDAHAASWQGETAPFSAADIWAQEYAAGRSDGRVAARPTPAPGDRTTIASSKDGFAIVDTKTETASHPRLDVAEKGIISVDYRRRVDNFLNSLPPDLVSWAKDNGVRVSVYNNSLQIPESMRLQHAQGHDAEETVGHIPMFYDPASKTLVFIEHPELTRSEQASKDRFEASKAYNESKSVKVYGQLGSFDPKAQHYAPIERNGIHEFGHALDQAGAAPFTDSADFDRAFKRGLTRVKPEQREELRYFTQADKSAPAGHQYDRAKRELFAELFAIDHCPKRLQQIYDSLLIKEFPEVLDLMRKDKRGLL